MYYSLQKVFFETKMNRFTFETLSITHIFRRVFMKANKVLAMTLAMAMTAGMLAGCGSSEKK